MISVYYIFIIIKGTQIYYINALVGLKIFIPEQTLYTLKNENVLYSSSSINSTSLWVIMDTKCDSKDIILFPRSIARGKNFTHFLQTLPGRG